MEQLLDPKTPGLLRSPPVLSKTFHWEMFHQNPPLLPMHLLLAKMVSLKSSSSFLKLPPSHLSNGPGCYPSELVQTEWLSLHVEGHQSCRVNMELEAKFPALPFVVTPMIFFLESTTNNNRTIAWNTKSHTLKITHRIGSVGRLLYPYVSKGCSGVALPNVS